MTKKDKKKKTAQQSAPLLTMDERQQVEAYLQHPKQLDLDNVNQQFPGPQFAQAFIEGLPTDDPQYIDYILAIGRAFEQKNVQKAVKKKLYKFKSRGITTPDYVTEDQQFSLQSLVKESEPLALLSDIFGDGYRGVIIILPKMPVGIDVGLGVISDQKGIVDFLAGRFGKKRIKEIKEHFAQSFKHLLEVSLDHAATVLEKAYHQKEAATDEATRYYLTLRPMLLEKVKLLERSPIFDHLKIEDLEVEPLTDSGVKKLLGHELMEAWIMDPEVMKPVVEETIKTEESQILVTQNQKADRLEEIKEKALITIFDDDKKALIKSRLEEMAFVFYKLELEEYVRLSLSAALSLEDHDSLFYNSPFLRGYLEQSLDMYIKGEEGPENKAYPMTNMGE